MATHDQLCGEILNYTRGAREQLDQVDALLAEVKAAHAGELARVRQNLPYQIVQAGFEHLFMGGTHENLHIIGPRADVFKTGPALSVRHCKVTGQRKATEDEHRARGGVGAPPHPDIIHALDTGDVVIEVDDLDTRQDNWEQPLMLNSKGSVSGVIEGWRSITKSVIAGGDACSHINSRCDGLSFRGGYLLGGGIDFGFGDDRQGTTRLETTRPGGLVFEDYGFQWLTISNGLLSMLAQFCTFRGCWTLDRFPRSHPTRSGRRKFGGVLPPGVTLVSEVPQEWREDAAVGEMEY